MHVRNRHVAAEDKLNKTWAALGTFAASPAIPPCLWDQLVFNGIVIVDPANKKNKFNGIVIVDPTNKKNKFNGIVIVDPTNK